MILDPNGSSFDNDKAHAFWHSDTGQSVLKVIKAATKDSGSGGGSDCGCDCYEVEETQKVLVPEQTVTTASRYNMIYASLADCVYDPSVVGNEATVVYNGVEYKCSPRTNANQFTTFVEFGGHRTYGNTGYSDDYSEYPFIVLINENAGTVYTEEPRTVSIKATAPSSDVIPSDNFKRAVRNSPGLRLKRDNTFINGRQTELIYDSEAVVTDANGNITAVIDRDLFAQIPTDALFPVSSNANQIVLGYYDKNGQRSTITIPIVSSSGDMTKNVYDNDRTIQNAGGIKNYVQTYVSEYGGGGDGTFAPGDPGHGGRTYSGMLAEPLWERAEDATAWGDPVWRAEIFNRGDSRIYGILRGDDRTVLDFIDGTGYMLQVSVSLNGLQRLVNAGVTGLLARIEKPDATERAFNALSYLPDSGDAPRLVLYAFGATPPEGVDIRVTATLLDWGGLG